MVQGCQFEVLYYCLAIWTLRGPFLNFNVSAFFEVTHGQIWQPFDDGFGG
jgi:hypothetical protein